MSNLQSENVNQLIKTDSKPKCKRSIIDPYWHSPTVDFSYTAKGNTVNFIATTRLASLAERNNSFRMLMNQMMFGKPSTPRSWFYEHKDPSALIKFWKDKLDNSDYTGKLEIAPWELSKLDKFQPQGEVAPFRDRLESFMEYFLHNEKPRLFSSYLWNKAKKTAIFKLKLQGQLHRLSPEEVLKNGLKADKYDTNSGYPLFMKRKRSEALDEALHDCSHSIAQQFPSTVGARASMGKTGSKARFIFMSSMAVNTYGQCFTQPLQEYLTKVSEFFTPWLGYDAVQSQLNLFLHSTRPGEYLLFGTDYDKMDQHFNLYHGLEVFDVIKHGFPQKDWNDLKTTIKYVFTQPILTPLGEVTQLHSLLSGSEWTNLIETVFDYILQEYINLILASDKVSVHISRAMGIGDDQLYLMRILTRTHQNKAMVAKITKIVVDIFVAAGMEANLTKQEVSFSRTTFLQRLLNYSDHQWQIGIYPIIRNLTSQVFPEFYHNEEFWNKYTFALRVLVICENCKMHPLFKEYATFCFHSNPACLDFMLNRVKRDQAIFNSKAIKNFLPSYTGNVSRDQLDTEGIESFATYQIWKSLIR